jgi:hypothetical protein
MELETECDPAEDLQRAVLAEDLCRELQGLLLQYKQENRRLARLLKRGRTMHQPLKTRGGTHGDSSPPLRLASILTCRVVDLFSLAQAEEIIEGTSSDDLDTLEATSAPLDDPEWIYKLKFDGC